jgi:hypothetical protein
MPEHEVSGDPAVYDQQTEEPRGRRRRVADWGVGEELFEHMPSPRRRFTPAEPPRRDSHPRERRAEAATPAGLDRDRRADAAPPRDLDASTRALVTAAREPAASAAPRPAASQPRTVTGGVEGRRTVVIGRQSAAPVRRERPSRTVGERVGRRPDRMAAYAVALGLLLIVIAFLSA